jgi:hypothetical protein
VFEHVSCLRSWSGGRWSEGLGGPGGRAASRCRPNSASAWPRWPRRDRIAQHDGVTLASGQTFQGFNQVDTVAVDVAELVNEFVSSVAVVASQGDELVGALDAGACERVPETMMPRPDASRPVRRRAGAEGRATRCWCSSRESRRGPWPWGSGPQGRPPTGGDRPADLTCDLLVNQGGIITIHAGERQGDRRRLGFGGCGIGGRGLDRTSHTDNTSPKWG